MLGAKAVRGAGWLILSRLSGRAIDFVTLLVLARILSPADFGTVALAGTLVAVLDTIMEVPVAQALIRLDRVDKAHLDTGFTINVLRSGLLAAVLLAAAWPFARLNGDPHLLTLVCVMALGPASRGFSSPALVQFSRQLGFGRTFLIEISGKLVGFAAAMTVLAQGGAYWAIVTNFVATSLAAVVMSYIVAPYRPALSLSRLSDFLSFIGWFSSAQVVAAVNWQFDRFLIGAFADKASLGRYAVANDLAVLPTQSIIGPALQPVMAAFSRMTAEPARLRAAFLKAARLTMLIAMPACLGIALTADLVIEVLLGQQWREAAPLLRLLSLAVLPIPYYQTLYSLNLALDRAHAVFRLNLIDLGIRIVLLPAGLALASIEGVGVARNLISAAMMVCYLLDVRRALGIGLTEQLANLWKVALSAAAMVGAVLWIRHGLDPKGLHPVMALALVAAAGGAAYGASLTLLGLRLRIGTQRLELVDRW